MRAGTVPVPSGLGLIGVVRVGEIQNQARQLRGEGVERACSPDFGGLERGTSGVQSGPEPHGIRHVFCTR